MSAIKNAEGEHAAVREERHREPGSRMCHGANRAPCPVRLVDLRRRGLLNT